MLCWESGNGLLLGLGFRVLLEGKHGDDIYIYVYIVTSIGIDSAVPK